MLITALAENTSSKHTVLAEHGLSLWIETNSTSLLFDTGQSHIFAQNAHTLGIDLDQAEFAVISHGHYDHGGGIDTFLRINDHAPVYLSRYAFEPHYNGTDKYIGLSPALADEPRLRFVEDTHTVAPNMTLYSMNDRSRPHSLGAFGLTTQENGTFTQDTFRHEHYLLIEENNKRILISGCSHKGIVDIVDWFRPDVLVGGFHLSKLSVGDTLDRIAEQLNRFPTVYYTCHCTGEAVYDYLRGRMTQLHYLAGGDTICI